MASCASQDRRPSPFGRGNRRMRGRVPPALTVSAAHATARPPGCRLASAPDTSRLGLPRFSQESFWPCCCGSLWSAPASRPGRVAARRTVRPSRQVSGAERNREAIGSSMSPHSSTWSGRPPTSPRRRAARDRACSLEGASRLRPVWRRRACRPRPKQEAAVVGSPVQRTAGLARWGSVGVLRAGDASLGWRRRWERHDRRFCRNRVGQTWRSARKQQSGDGGCSVRCPSLACSSLRVEAPGGSPLWPGAAASRAWHCCSSHRPSVR
jgi:hypothetical protein